MVEASLTVKVNYIGLNIVYLYYYSVLMNECLRIRIKEQGLPLQPSKV